MLGSIPAYLTAYENLLLLFYIIKSKVTKLRVQAENYGQAMPDSQYHPQ